MILVILKIPDVRGPINSENQLFFILGGFESGFRGGKYHVPVGTGTRTNIDRKVSGTLWFLH
jgi:hypothetical protein